MKFFKTICTTLLLTFILLSGFNPRALPASTAQEIQNLRAFTKLYGYVKYFHPSDEASRIDWDRFAVYGSQKVKDAQNPRELKTILEELFLPIAPTIQIYFSKNKPSPLVIPKNTENLKVVAWQHLGVGLSAAGPIYRSIRTNRETIFSGAGYGFGTVTQSVDATDYRGKEIKLKASVRTHVTGSGNQGQLWLRVDRESKQIGFFDNMNDRPIQSTEWRTYEIVGSVADDATAIFFGCFLHGLGQVWVDDFQLFYKNETGNWQAIPVNNPGFELKTDGQPKMWSASSPGYTYEVQSDNPFEGDNSLLIENKGEKFSGTLFDKFPSVGEVINKELDAGLFFQVPLALYSDSIGTIGQKSTSAFDALMDQLDKIDANQMTADNEYVRLGNIIITWNIFQHFYPYFDLIDTDWNAELTHLLEETLTNQNERDFYYTLKRMIAGIHDGHGGVYHEISKTQAGLPFLVDWIEDKVVIIFSIDTSIFKVGDVVVSIDGVSSAKKILDDEEYISGSPQWKRYRSMSRFGYGEEGSIAKLQIKRGGRILEIEATRDNKDPLSEPEKPTIEEIENDIYYVNLSKAEMTEISKKMEKLSNAKGVIFDMRGYPKGNHQVICHLLSSPDTSDAWMRVPQIIYPDRKNIFGFTNHGWFLQPSKPHIKGKVVFLTDGRAISYAESYMSFIDFYKLADIVGQPTAGTNGNVNSFQLPGDFRVTWTGMKVVKHDGSQHHLVGIQPTVLVERTLRGIIEGRDEFIEKALQIINRES